MTPETPTTKNFFLDKKDAKYYKDRFLNNCSMRNRYIVRMKNNLVTFEQNLSMMENLDENKDPFVEKDTKFTEKIRSLVNDLNSTIETYVEDLNAEMLELKSKDYEAIIKNNEEEIREKERKDDHTEL